MDLLGVVWYAHKTLGNSSAYLPLLPSNLFFNPVHNYLVSSFSLTVTLQIHRGGIPVLDTKIATKLAEGFAIKLQPIIRYQGL